MGISVTGHIGLYTKYRGTPPLLQALCPGFDSAGISAAKTARSSELTIIQITQGDVGLSMLHESLLC